MAISPFEIHGMMGRTQDFTALKHQEDNRNMVAQSAFQNQAEKKIQNKAERVQDAQQSETNRQKKDARDKGSNEYAGDGGQKRKRTDQVPLEGRVVRKGPEGSHFECSI